MNNTEQREIDGDVVIQRRSACSYTDHAPSNVRDVAEWIDNVRTSLNDTSSGIRWIQDAVMAHHGDDGSLILRHPLNQDGSLGALITADVNVVVP